MFSLSIVCTLLSLLPGTSHADEGMFPVSKIHDLPLKARGLLIDSKEIYNPGTTSILDAIVNVGGCSGSFVSPEGLILTNHHCAFKAIQSVSSEGSDYLTGGFLALKKSEELPAAGYTARITESYSDVSTEVLSAIADTLDPGSRTRVITRRIKEIVARAESSHTGLRADVAEMFPGVTYVLFLYRYFQDVRMVYVPPRAIGEFGGEEDNWEWPRHTGDFAFLRVYTAPDGSPRSYSPENVPFTPRRYLKVQSKGVTEGDFVFLLGYPGRTYRHNTTHYLSYEQDVRLPYVAGLNSFHINIMEKLGKGNPDHTLRYAPRIKSLANTMKNYQGKLQGLRRLGLIERKQSEEKELQRFINANPDLRNKYGTLLEKIGAIYNEMRTEAPRELILDHLLRSSYLLEFGFSVYEAAIERQKPDLDRIARYMDRSYRKTVDDLLLKMKDYSEGADRLMLRDMLIRASHLSDGMRIPAIPFTPSGKKSEMEIDAFLDNLFRESLLAEPEIVRGLFHKSPEEILALGDPCITFVQTLYPSFLELRATRQRRTGMLTKMHAQLLEVRQQFMGDRFIPDANGTLRLTFGQIRGYSPADAVVHTPMTTLKGLVARNTGREFFTLPDKLIATYRNGDFGMFKDPALNDVPVALLYNLDTTGGSSGSALMNARGELVGVNFDRTFHATVNDYAWGEEYSRSIGVDIRFVLWVTDRVAGASYLLREMGL